MFKLLKTEGKARRGEFTCAHGTVQTPVFMNVGTQGAIKGALSAEDLKNIEDVDELEGVAEEVKDDVKDAQDKVYAAIDDVSFENSFYRHDIGGKR